MFRNGFKGSVTSACRGWVVIGSVTPPIAAMVLAQPAVVFTTQLAQTPYIIQRGPVSVGGKLNFIAADETPYTTMLSNTQPQLQLVIGNGVVGAGKVQVQVDCQKAAYATSKPDFGKAAVGYQTTFVGVANTTNAGTSGGYSPVKVTLNNAIASGIYV